jgi:hypothetical protein
MPGEHYIYTPFDEQAALEKLERLRLAVEQSRKRRKDLSDEFDAFVSSFRKDGRSDTTPPPPRPSAETRPVVRAYEEPMPDPAPAAAARRPVPKTGVVIGAVAVLAAGLMLTRTWRGSPADHPSTTSTSTPTRAGMAPGSVAAAETQPIPGMLRGELAAVREVWIRATADGARVVERTLQANERVPIRPARTLTIRAGDAGAVRIVIDGRDQGPLGANGTSVTRTFTASAPGTR